MARMRANGDCLPRRFPRRLGTNTNTGATEVWIMGEGANSDIATSYLASRESEWGTYQGIAGMKVVVVKPEDARVKCDI